MQWVEFRISFIFFCFFTFSGNLLPLLFLIPKQLEDILKGFATDKKECLDDLYKSVYILKGFATDKKSV